MAKKTQQFDDIKPDQTFGFYGICDNCFKLDGTIYEAIEDKDDGYRSCLESVIVVKGKKIFFPNPVATVKVVKVPTDYKNSYGGTDSQDIHELIDVSDGHIWLRVGTDNTDDYYPYFVFDYFPKAAK